MSILQVAALVLCAAAGTSAQTIHYVSAAATGAGNGASWQNAFTSLQDALAAAAPGDQVWVASGMYRPDQGDGLTPGDRSLSFEMKSGVRLHGGFIGSETSKGDRNLSQNASILSGDLQGDDDGFVLNGENSLHVVRAVDADDNSVLDGFVVIGGNANGEGPDSLGGGILISGGAPWIVNTRVNSSWARCGGGLAIVDGAAPTSVNVAAHGNRAQLGGGLCVMDAAPSLVNATVTSNAAASGAGIYNEASDVTVSNSIVALNEDVLNLDGCVLGQYPCSEEQVSPDAVAETERVIQAARAASPSGTTEEALAYLRSEPSVVSASGNEVLVSARVRGGTTFLLYDSEQMDALGKTDAPVPVVAHRNAAWAAFSAGATSPGGRTIVGEDLNSDGRIDNRDGKRALVLAPLETADALGVYVMLGETRDYHQIDAVGSEAWIDDFANWDDYDFIYFAGHIFGDCPENSEFCEPVLLTGIFCGEEECPGTDPFPDVIVATPLSTNDRRLLSMKPGFFRRHYPAKMDNAMVYCAACDVLNPTWREAMGGGNFALLGWEKYGPLEAFGPSNLQMVKEMARGISLLEAGQVILPALELNPVQLETARVGLHAPSPTAWRIVELPTLLYQPNPSTTDFGMMDLQDGMDITHLIEGTVGDEQPDRLKTFLRVDGLLRPRADRVQIRYRVDGNPVEGTFTLDTTAVQLPDIETSYLFTHDLDLGFPVRKGLLPIEAIVEIPGEEESLYEGESQYSVVASVDAFECSSSAGFGGFRSGAFSGPANWVPDGDFATLTIESVESAIAVATGPAAASYDFNYTGSFFLEKTGASGDTLIYNMLTGSLGRKKALDTWFFATSDDCDCGGEVRVDSVSSDGGQWIGSIEFTGKDVTGTNQDPKTSTLKGRFKALVGSRQQVSSPYFQCLDQYWQLYGL